MSAIISHLIAWFVHVFFYWILPIPIVIVAEIVLRHYTIKKRDAVGINFELQYKVAQIADRARTLPFIGKSIFAIAHLGQMHIIYNLVMKEGKRQWKLTHKTPQSLKQKSVPDVTKLSGNLKKSAPSVDSTKKKLNSI